MTDPIERIQGTIKDVTPEGKLTIEAYYPNIDILIKREYKNVEIELIDSRPLSANQRKMCWAMITAIADWQGEDRGEMAKIMINEARKVDFLINELCENGARMFSLSDAPMSLVAAYQKYLIHFILENNIPTKKPLYEYAEDIEDYLYYCTLNKVCAVCGRGRRELHHLDTVGMGNDRDDICHEGMEAMPLCREHHTVAHTMGNKDF